MDTLNAPVQAIEVDKNGKLVWQLRAWKKPDLGPSTTIQLLEEPINREHFEAIQGFHAGVKKSGIGGADGKHGVEEYLVTHVTYLDTWE